MTEQIDPRVDKDLFVDYNLFRKKTYEKPVRVHVHVNVHVEPTRRKCMRTCMWTYMLVCGDVSLLSASADLI